MSLSIGCKCNANPHCANRIQASAAMSSVPPLARPQAAPSAAANALRGLPPAAWRAFWICAGIAAVLAALVVAGNIYGSRVLTSNVSTSDKPLQLVIGNDVLDVPENMIRHASQRVPGVTRRVDLKIHWPERSGFKLALTEGFADTDPQTTPIVLVSIAPRQWLLDMADRYDMVYRKAIDTEVPERRQHGLTFSALDPSHGYIDETLAYAPPAGGALRPAFIARCNEPKAGRTPLLLACEKDLFFGETLEARVRFPAHFLADWAGFQAELDALLNGFLVEER